MAKGIELHNTITIEEPIKFGLKLKISFKELLNALGLGIISVATPVPSPGGILRAVSSFLKSFKVSGTPAGLSYNLIFFSIAHGTADALKSHYGSLSQEFDGEWYHKSWGVFEETLNNTPIILDYRFFSNPDKIKFIEEYEKAILSWLVDGFSLERAKALQISSEINDRFVFHLISEYGSNLDKYVTISATLDHVFTDLDLVRAVTRAYKKDLASLYDQPALAEVGITLSDLYVKPSFHIHERCFYNDDERTKTGRVHPKGQEGTSQKPRPTEYIKLQPDNDLEGFAINFLIDSQNKFHLNSGLAKVLVILGLPGQGKTSFCYRLTNQLIKNHLSHRVNIWLIRLKDIVNLEELFSNPGDTLCNHLRKSLETQMGVESIPISNNAISTRAIWILDGLDELRMKSGISASKIDQLCSDLAAVTQTSSELKIILTSRHGYFNGRTFEKEEFLVVEIARLSSDQQLEWLRRYKSKRKDDTPLEEEELKRINESVTEPERAIQELIDQPILLHMIATSGVDFSGQFHRASIYNQLFSKLINRQWEKSQIHALQGIEEDSFRQFLQETALRIYQSDFEYIRKVDLMELKSAQDLLKILNNQELGLALRQILISFYFTEVKKDILDDEDLLEDGYTAIEFLHKSFQEYLVAEAVWESLKEFSDTRSKRGKVLFVIDDSRDAINHLAPLTVPKVFSPEVIQYLREIISTSGNSDEIKVIAGRMGEFLDKISASSFFPGNENLFDHTPFWASINFAYSYILFLSLCPRESQIEIDFSVMQAIRTISVLEAFPSLPLLNFSFRENVNLSRIHFHSSTFSKSSFKNVEIAFSSICDSDLSHCTFSSCNFDSVDLNLTNLSHSVFEGGEIAGSNFENSVLNGIRIIQSFIKGTDLRDSSAEGLQFEGVEVDESDFSGTNFSGAVFSNCIFNESDFSVSTFSKCEFQDCIFREVEFLGASILDSKIEGGEIADSNLKSVDFNGTTIEHVKIHNTNLSEAKNVTYNWEEG